MDVRQKELDDVADDREIAGSAREVVVEARETDRHVAQLHDVDLRRSPNHRLKIVEAGDVSPARGDTKPTIRNEPAAIDVDVDLEPSEVDVGQNLIRLRVEGRRETIDRRRGIVDADHGAPETCSEKRVTNEAVIDEDGADGQQRG